MGKQTNKSGSNFGGQWTKQKLHIIEEYLKAYSLVLKNQKVKKIYVDGFAGSGKTEIKQDSKDSIELFVVQDNINNTKTSIIDGSPLLSLKYNFDEYYFIELDHERANKLKENVLNSFPEKAGQVHIITGDSNFELLNVVSKITKYDRCLMFLDPYALELNWSTLEAISKCGVIDLWYLFPLSIIRLMNKDGKITEANKERINMIIGSSDWYNSIFKKSNQINMFGEVSYDRISYEELLKFFMQRFSSIFTYVSQYSKVLNNADKNAPMFMLCFMMTNDSPKAIGAADRIVKGIIKSTEKINGNN